MNQSRQSHGINLTRSLGDVPFIRSYYSTVLSSRWAEQNRTRADRQAGRQHASSTQPASVIAASTYELRSAADEQRAAEMTGRDDYWKVNYCVNYCQLTPASTTDQRASDQQRLTRVLTDTLTDTDTDTDSSIQ